MHTPIRSEFEKDREEMMDNEADDLPFRVHPRTTPNSFGIFWGILLIGLAIPLFYLVVSLVSGVAGSPIGFALLTIAMVVVWGVTLAAAYWYFNQNRNEGENMKVTDVMSKEPVACGTLDSVYDCARDMYQHNVGFLVVRNEKDEFVGIITDRDLVCGAVAQGLDNKSTPITTLMVTDFKSVTRDSSIDHVMRLMREEGIRRIPVIEGKTCYGIITLDDLIMKKACRLEDVASILEKQLSEPMPGHGVKVDRDQSAA